ncbi:MAG: Na+/H+ antiporter subunit E [Lachnospiraceae bacterium]|nr:Na+/H+ antiporter subunit E [Lachnospiraceae bacterium]
MFIIFFIVWVLFNGQLTLEIEILGLFVAALLYAFICRFMNWSLKKDRLMLRYTGFIFSYLFLLVKEIVKANIDTAKMIFAEKIEREPVVYTFHTKVKSPVLRFLLANSITLTPGTLTVELEGDLLKIHAIDRDYIQGDFIFEMVLRDLEEAADAGSLKGEDEDE